MLVVIRHGSGLSAELGVVGGHGGCRGLSQKGRLEALTQAEKLKAMGVKLELLGQSMILRSQETAEIIAPYLSAKLIEPSCGICELHPGPYDGQSVVSLPASVDPYSNPDVPYLPGAERVSDLNKRVKSYLADLADCAVERGVGIVTHLGVIRSIAEMTIGVDPDALVRATSPASAWIFGPSKLPGKRLCFQLLGASR
ncbi:MAG: hypothetical protein HKL81_00140 [Acidimicrobiaceae bacterium]|nr:hypothetical protein [Acidimicrobiaceae bacterium]